jgi:hypothetical protein
MARATLTAERNIEAAVSVLVFRSSDEAGASLGPRTREAFFEADDGTRTHDLLHGKQTL